MKPVMDIPADEAPPPYEAKPRENPVPETQIPHPPSPRPPMPPPSQVARQFPPAFNVYTQSFSRTLTLGEHQNQPWFEQFAANRAALRADEYIPTACFGGIPQLQQQDEHNAAPCTKRQPGGAPVIDLESKMDFPSLSYYFAMGVGPNCERVEQFQWRPSSGEAIAMLDGRRRGWKLVRLAQSAGPAAFRGSDGKEVVAVWTDAEMSLSKQAKFAFMGSGLTGELGERWAVMAVISGLAIFERQRQRRRSHNH